MSEKVERLLTEQEAERQDIEERLRRRFAPAIRFSARRVVAMLSGRRPSFAARRRARDWFLAEVLVSLILSTPVWRRMVRRQVEERRRAFRALKGGPRPKLRPTSRAAVSEAIKRRRLLERARLPKPTSTPPISKALRKKLAADARDPAGRLLPARESLDTKPVEYLFRLAERLGADVDLGRLRAAFEAASRQVLSAGQPDIPTLLAAQERAEAAVQRELAREAKGWVREAERKEMGLGPRDLATWQAVLDEKSCASCEDRHGDERQMRSWENSGLPGDDSLVCDGNCRCELIPSDWLDGDVD